MESVPQVTCRLEMGFPLEQRLRHWAEQNSAEVLDVHYSQSVAMTLRCPTQSLDDLESLCAAEQIALTVL